MAFGDASWTDAVRQPLQGFHPAVSRWFADSLGAPTAAQRRGWEAIRRARHTLIAAPTGSGKTLAAFLIALDELLREGLPRAAPRRNARRLRLAAQGAQQRHPQEPGRAARGHPRCAARWGWRRRRSPSAVRTGDTPASARAGDAADAAAHPGHDAGVAVPAADLRAEPRAPAPRAHGHRRRDPRGDRHAARRAPGALARTARVARRNGRRCASACRRRSGRSRRSRVSWSAAPDVDAAGDAALRDRGRRAIAATSTWRIELPGSPLEAVMSHEVWAEYYDRLAALIQAHRTTLVFVNTRKMAERVARHLCRPARRGAGRGASRQPLEGAAPRRGDAAEATASCGRWWRRRRSSSASTSVTSTSCARSDRRDASRRCSSASAAPVTPLRGTAEGPAVSGDARRPRRVRGAPCAPCGAASSIGWSRSRRRSTCWRSRSSPRPRAASGTRTSCSSSCAGVAVSPTLTRRTSTRSCGCWPTASPPAAGGAAALVHRDEVQRPACWRRASARLTALTSGGAIPDNADYRVVLDPDETVPRHAQRGLRHREQRRRHLPAGQQLRGASCRSAPGSVRVADAHGAPPTIPFWLGEAPARSAELSDGGQRAACAGERSHAEPARQARPIERRATPGWSDEPGVSRGAAEQIVDYLAESLHILGALPTRTRSCSSDSSTSPAACSWCCTRRSAAASTARGRSRCASGSAASSTSSCRRRRPKRGCCCRSARSMRSRSPMSSATCIRRRCATSWFRRCSTRRSSRPAGAGTRPSRSRWPACMAAQGAGAAAADAGGRSARGRVSRRGGVPREHSRRSADPRSPAGRTRRCATASRRRWTCRS